MQSSSNNSGSNIRSSTSSSSGWGGGKAASSPAGAKQKKRYEPRPLFMICLDAIGKDPRSCLLKAYARDDSGAKDATTTREARIVDAMGDLAVAGKSSADMLVECGELVCRLVLRSIVTRGKLTLPLVELFTEAAHRGGYGTILDFFDKQVDVYRALGAVGNRGSPSPTFH